ncbi:MAG: hypothetical protein ACE5R6_04040 [Candidatus Heimdallarchaeota archaeon]
MTIIEPIYVFDLMVWGAAIGGLAFFSYSASLDYRRKELEFKLYLALATLAFFIANISHILNTYISPPDWVDFGWRFASVFDGITLLTWSVSVSIFMEFEKPKSFLLPGLSVIMILVVISLPNIDHAKLIGYIIAAIILIAITWIYVNMARISAGAIRTKAMFFAIGFLCLLLGRLLRSSLVVGLATASPITILGGFVILFGLVLLAHT